MPRILYVEDEPFLAKIVKESLESRGFEIKHLDEGGRVSDVFKIWKPDLCILDIMLPTKDGYQVAEEIRMYNTQVPILFLTAREQPEDVINGFKKGGNDYVKKPFSMEELILRIENLLRLTGVDNNSENIIAIGAYSFHPKAMILKIKDDEIRLSHRENEIIRKLYEGRNNRIERKELLMDIWGDDSFFNSRNLDVYIRKIRTYFEQDSRIKILTLKGVGYHFYIEN